MPRLKGINKVLVVGSGPIIIGQAAEFDYAGTQACKALKEEGIEVVLVNSNPATIMTDTDIADRVYIEPIAVDVIENIISKERPDGLIAGLGGQTGLNMAVELDEAGILKKYNVKLLGTKLDAIKRAEDRELFKSLMEEIGEPVPESVIVETLEDGLAFADKTGFPIIIRPAYTLGGTGGGLAETKEEFIEILKKGLSASRIHQALIERSVAGWKEIEYEVMRDNNDTVITICNMENIDPVGIHTGDSIVVAPCLTLRADECDMLKGASMRIIRALKIAGGCNVQFALNPKSKEYVVIEVNPRVSRSSALASKATGYPIAKITAKIAVGFNLHELPNYITKETKAAFEPAIDYVVLKVPTFPFDKFNSANRTLGTQMKATGEVMSIGRSFEFAFLKAMISLEGAGDGLRRKNLAILSKTEILEKLTKCEDDRILVVAEAFRKGITVEELNKLTAIDPFFLNKIKGLTDLEQRLTQEKLNKELLEECESVGFTDTEIEALSKVPGYIIDSIRRAHGLYPVYKRVDTCAGEFSAKTPYYYSSFDTDEENDISKNQKIIVIGSGPIRIGQGIEFDYCSVHAVWATQQEGFESIIINNNPETVSTDFDTADKLYFEPLYIEDVINIIRKEEPKGVIVQFGGQTAINLAPKLVERGVQILGTSMDSIDVAEDRERFEVLLKELGIPQPKGQAVNGVDEAKAVAKALGYPVLVRPSYVIGGRGMQVVHSEADLVDYVQGAAAYMNEHPALIDKYIDGIEVEVDAVSDGIDVLIPGIMEHIEHAGVHSGDSISVYPPQTISAGVIAKLEQYTAKIAKAIQVKGLMNIQFVVSGEEVYVIEVNPRASRTVPILSKITGIPMVKLAIKVILGEGLKDLGYGTGLLAERDIIAVKAPVFSFAKLTDVDPALAPEMKSTGEVLGIAKTYGKALYKAFRASGYTFAKSGTVFVKAKQPDAERLAPIMRKLQAKGFKIEIADTSISYFKNEGIEAISETVDGAIEKMRRDEYAMVINLPQDSKYGDSEGLNLRKMAVQYKISLFTCADTVEAYIKAMEAETDGGEIAYRTIVEYFSTI